MILHWKKYMHESGKQSDYITAENVNELHEAYADFGVFTIEIHKNNRVRKNGNEYVIHLFAWLNGIATGSLSLGTVCGTLHDAITAAEKHLFSQKYMLPKECIIHSDHHADERMVVFLCKKCISDLRYKLGSYANAEGKPIHLSKLITITIPKEECERDALDLSPILLSKKDKFPVTALQRKYLFRRLLEDVDPALENMVVRFWRQEDRDSGTPKAQFKFDGLWERCVNPEDPTVELVEMMKEIIGEGGCAELIASDDYDEYCLYHFEGAEEYVTEDFFDRFV